MQPPFSSITSHKLICKLSLKVALFITTPMHSLLILPFYCHLQFINSFLRTFPGKNKNLLFSPPPFFFWFLKGAEFSVLNLFECGSSTFTFNFTLESFKYRFPLKYSYHLRPYCSDTHLKGGFTGLITDGGPRIL